MRAVHRCRASRATAACSPAVPTLKVRTMRCAHKHAVQGAGGPAEALRYCELPATGLSRKALALTAY